MGGCGGCIGFVVAGCCEVLCCGGFVRVKIDLKNGGGAVFWIRQLSCLPNGRHATVVMLGLSSDLLQGLSWP